jgi:hypothetical protein
MNLQVDTRQLVTPKSIETRSQRAEDSAQILAGHGIARRSVLQVVEESERGFLTTDRQQPTTSYWVSVLCQFLHRAEEIVDLRQDGVFQNRLVSDERVGGCDAAHRRIQLVEELIRDARRDLCAIAPA